MRTGSFSQPRTVEVRACTALSWSISQSGNRASTSSSAMRRLEARQVGAQAEVDAVAEAQVPLDLAGDVEAVRVRELALVAVGRPVQQHHRAAGRDGLS